MKRKLIYCIAGFLAGIVNGLLGAAGGMILVPMLSKNGMDTKKTHANSVAVIMIICIFSIILYLQKNEVTLEMSYPYIIWGVLGSIVGSLVLTKMKDVWIKRIFGLLMIWASVRLLIK